MTLPAIIGAISAVGDLFDTGKQVYEAVAGKPSAAADAPALQAEIEALPADRQQAFVDQMRLKIEMYRAQTDRLKNEQGEVTADLLQALPPAAAAKVAQWRMTTRPKIAWLMTHVVALPFYVVLLDGLFIILNWVFLFSGYPGKGIPLLAGVFVDKSSPYLGLYEQSAWPATTIVITYMTLTEIGKARGGKDAADVGVKDIVSSVTGAVGALKNAFKK